MLSLRTFAPTAFAVLALYGSLSSPTHAATFNVNSNGSAQGLIDAINAANSNGEADTINLSGSVNFTAADNATYGPTGFPVIKNDGALTINGAGNFFIGRVNNVNNPRVRIFAIAPGANVTLNNVRFAGGSAGAGGGGDERAIANRGGAIYGAEGASLTLNGCDFDGNTAVSGGAIFAGERASVGMSGGSMRFNTSDGNGGAIFSEGGALALENVSFNGNTATGVIPDQNGRGGAIYLRNDARSTGFPFALGTLTAKGCSFGDNNNGNFARGGGAISSHSSGAVRIEASVFNRNSALFGGAIENVSTLTILASSFVANRADRQGGAIFTQGRPIDLSNCTFSGNSNNGDGAAIYHFSNVLTLESCTLTGNTGGAALTSTANTSSFARIHNTIIAGNSTDVEAEIIPGFPYRQSYESGGYNLIGRGDAAVFFNAPGDQTGVSDPRLGPLRDNGGATPTIAPQLGSPAIDAGQSALATDQVGHARPVDDPSVANAAGGDGSDIGAFETDTAQTPSDYTGLLVNRTDDHDDGVCGVNDCTLREAINGLNNRRLLRFIAFDEAVFGSNRRTIKLNGTALPTVSRSFDIAAPSKGVVIDAGGRSGIFRVAGNNSLGLRGLTLRGGNTTDGGAALDVGTGARATLVNCTMPGNRSTFEGGAIRNNRGDVTLRQCTLTDNASQVSGSTISNENGRLTIQSCTIAGSNRVVLSQGASQTETTVYNSIIVAGGGSAVDSFDESGAPNGNAFRSDGYNLITSGNAAGAFNQSGDRVLAAASDAFLLELRDNGGIVPTLALLPGSPAINAGDPAFRVDANGYGGTQFDARDSGFARVRDGRVDIGAFEVQNDAPRVTVAIVPQAPKTADVLTARPTGSDPDGNSITYSYRWLRNGVQLNEFEPTLKLAKPGNGDKGDTISVIVRATDSEGASATATAQVTIVNSAPVAVSSQGSVPADTEKAFPLLAFDADGDPLTFKRVGGPNNGTADIRVDPADGQLKLFYRSRARYGGVEVIRFVALDNEGKPSDVSTLGISVQYTPPPPANRAPIAGDTNIDTVVGRSEIKGLLGSDPDGDAITFRIVNNAKFGQSEIRRDTDGQFKLFYTSLPRFFGPDRVTYIVTDSRGRESNLATVNINFVNRSPVAQNNELQVASGELVSQFLFADDPDNDAVTFRLVNNPQFGQGEIRRDPQGAWRVYYRSVPGYVGSDRITFIAIDPFGKESQVATAGINVVRVGPAPSASRSSAAPSGGGS